MAAQILGRTKPPAILRHKMCTKCLPGTVADTTGRLQPCHQSTVQCLGGNASQRLGLAQKPSTWKGLHCCLAMSQDFPLQVRFRTNFFTKSSLADAACAFAARMRADVKAGGFRSTSVMQLLTSSRGVRTSSVKVRRPRSIHSQVMASDSGERNLCAMTSDIRRPVNHRHVQACEGCLCPIC